MQRNWEHSPLAPRAVKVFAPRVESTGIPLLVRFVAKVAMDTAAARARKVLPVIAVMPRVPLPRHLVKLFAGLFADSAAGMTPKVVERSPQAWGLAPVIVRARLAGVAVAMG